MSNLHVFGTEISGNRQRGYQLIKPEIRVAIYMYERRSRLKPDRNCESISRPVVVLYIGLSKGTPSM
jgi:hypothetical protein